ncbi:hypothetical protein SLEP1_g3468 [Rubroshorea leprosula]|uniref:Uncharacterized protein n=1 Tax=Rubroshorea leprosula TaxID=152421 RepID=A0AAV5HRK6_9ROSI|nr:hypothetical protein SLEP1_g3468 [Rubroshorea leprosula]
MSSVSYPNMKMPSLYYKGVKAATEGVKDPVKTNDPSSMVSSTHPDLFEGNFTERKKWVDVKSFFGYGSFYVLHER